MAGVASVLEEVVGEIEKAFEGCGMGRVWLCGDGGKYSEKGKNVYGPVCRVYAKKKG